MESAHLQAVTAARTLEETAREARTWYRRVGASQPWTEPVRRAQIVATLAAESEGRHVRESANRRQCVGIFGPSQVGKSFLMESLGAADVGGPGGPRSLMVRFAGQRTMDFLREINPAGDRESTGLVTRFTADQAGAATDATHPVELRLLSETDLVKMLTNAFFSDFDHERREVGLPDRERIGELLRAAERRAGDALVAEHLDEVAMCDLAQYFRQNFAGSNKPLEESGYWQALTSFGHRLPRAERTALYAVLWGEVAPITELFTRLVGVLEHLGHSADVRTTLDALAQRAPGSTTGGCIIDVELLRQLYDPRADGDRLSVVPVRDGRDGTPVPVARAELVALTAELKMVMAAPPSDLFAHTDMLDFPGARSRHKEPRLPKDREKLHELLCTLLIRGKVAYLFQRYTEDSDLSCMLLCVKESNQEVKDLPAMVTRWVERMQGATATERAQRACALFLVLTRFDTIWESKGAADTEDRWRLRVETRLTASLENFRNQSWFGAWTPDTVFRNTYFIRNPKFGGHSNDDAEQARRLQFVREGVATSALCRAHVADGEAAWNAMAGPDGGAGRLMSALREVLHPTLKLGQLQARLGVAARGLDDELKKLHRGEDDEARAERQAALKQLVGARLPSANRGMVAFYRFLSRLSLTAAEARQVYEDVVARHALEPVAAQAAAVSAPPASSLDLDDLLGDGPSAPAAVAAVAAEPPPAAPARRDDADEFGSAVVAAWLERVRRVVSDRETLAALSLDAGAVADLLEVWQSGAHRLDLAGQIARRVGPQMRTAGRRSEVVAQRCAVIAAAAVDDFLAFNGSAEQPVERRPRSGGRPVFAFPPLPADGLPQLEEKPSHGISTLWWGDWAVSLIKLGVDNIGHTGAPGEIDAHDNETLGSLRRRLRPLVAAA